MAKIYKEQNLVGRKVYFKCSKKANKLLSDIFISGWEYTVTDIRYFCSGDGSYLLEVQAPENHSLVIIYKGNDLCAHLYEVKAKWILKRVPTTTKGAA